MYALVVGIVFLILKLMGVGPVAEWGWVWVLSPFALAAIWWAWADFSGFSQKKAMQKMEKRKQERLEKQRKAIDGRSHRR